MSELAKPILEPARLLDKSYREEYNRDFLCWSIASQVRSNRVAREWSQAELAKRAGVSFASVNRIEGGCKDNLPLLETLTRIAQAFDAALRVYFTDWQDFISHVLEITPDGLIVKSFNEEELLAALTPKGRP